jgi:serine/threonine protein kinase
MWGKFWVVADDRAPRTGGQGSVVKVTNISNKQLGALKQLHPQHMNSRERRFRMQQEANALVALEGKGVPRLLSSNADQWNEKGCELYLVMEWIDGPTLSETCSGRPFTIDEAVAVAIPILDTVERCHGLPIFHRDLKPDNVILQHGSHSDPILVDFGMAWAKPAEDESRSFDTPVGQELGNRFLRLPELAPGRDARDPRSDVSMVVGLLFYMITGIAPRTLDDGQGRMPHEALEARFPESVRKDRRWLRMQRIFNIGFQSSLDLRFQDVGPLRSRLLDLEPANGTSDELRLKEELAAISDILNSVKGRSIAAGATALSAAAERFMQAFRRTLEGSGFTYGGSGPNLVNGGLGCDFYFFLVRNNTSEPQALFHHTLTIQNTTVSARVQIERGEWEEYYSGPISDPDGLGEALERKAANVVQRLLGAMKEKLSVIYR